MGSVQSLTIHGIRRTIDGVEVGDFDDIVVAGRLESVTEKRDFTAANAADAAWTARLYVWPGDPLPPTWLDYLRDGFGEDLQVPDATSSAALVVLRVRYRVVRYFAVTFGAGRHAIRREALEPGYGLRVALNALYEGDRDADVLDPAARVRQVDSRTVGANTLRTTRQANRAADFDSFELDPDGDQLRGITGRPVKIDEFGSRLRGTDTVRIGRSSVFDELGGIRRNLARYHERTDYKRRLGFVDNLQPEFRPGVVATLREHTAVGLIDHPGEWAFAPPEIVDFDDVASFSIPELGITNSDLDLAVLAQNGVGIDDVTDLTVVAIDNNGQVTSSWPLLDCVDGQITLTHSDETYIADGGEYYLVNRDHLDQLDDYIDGIGLADIALIDSTRINDAGELKEITEGAYNLAAAAADPQLLCLDAQTVRVSTRTSAIEVCDLLSLDGHLIHVKRKFASGALSHLFAQGFVSSELFVDNPDYRAATRTLIDGKDPAFTDIIPANGFVAANYQLVFAIIGDWTDRTTTDLPFFSKINLRKHTRTLRRYGYHVRLAKVQVVDP